MMKLFSSISNKKGVLFIEIMISMTILALVGVGALKAFVLGKELIRINTHKSTALYWAQLKIEEIRQDSISMIIQANYPQENVTLDDSDSPGTLPAETADDLIAVMTTFITLHGNASLRRVAVNISWTWQGKTFSETLQTIVGDS